ncbi:MAG: HAD-IB family phosphatase [Candidatus Eremiobacteraeota bacterium]|nr:HAD-IB family phosphatase [Candidatus Eremiobacteraeota bacterium]
MFVDFDGTITDRDTFDVLVSHFAGADAWYASEAGLRDGSLALRDVLQLQASYVRGTLEDVAALLRREVRFDPGFAPFARACRASGIDVTVVSSGLEPIVRGRLHDAGVDDIPVIANDIEPARDGWVIHFRDPVGNGTDKAALVLAAKARGRYTVFIGDGVSDYDAALVADRRYAKAGSALERFLCGRNVKATSFASFSEITFP